MDKLKKGQKQQVAAMKESAKSRGGYQKDERIWKYSGVEFKSKESKKPSSLNRLMYRKHKFPRL